VSTTRIYLTPGLFGFARVASFNYFEHLIKALESRYAAQGRKVAVSVCEVHPTASIRRRAVTLAEMIHETTGQETGPIHIIGHSTGGLDARLLASPCAQLGLDPSKLAWLERLRSITTMNTPHHGTPLAAFFATVSGQRLLYATSALTVTALKLGAPPLAATSALVGAFGRVELRGLELGLVDRFAESVIRVLDDAASRDLRRFLALLRDDSGAIVQLMPEAMDLFHGAVADRPGVRYQSVASYAPRNGAAQWLSSLRSPWSILSSAIFTALYNVTARHDPRYPCVGPTAERDLRRVLGEAPPLTASDGVVPLYSQVWGELVWAGKADHLDVVGHFPGPGGHNDWMTSGSRFNRARFDTMVDCILVGMARASAPAVTPLASRTPSLA
jgi:hypothetical protein